MLQRLAIRLHSLRRCESGAAAMEFGLLSLGFIILIAMIFEFGMMMWTNTSLQDAADHAARYAGIHVDASEAQVLDAAGERMSQMMLSATPLDVDVTWDTINDVDVVQVTATYAYEFRAAFFLPAALRSLELSARASRSIPQ